VIKIFLIVTLISSIIFSLAVAGGDAMVKRKEISWQSISGSKIPGIKAFIDANSLITISGVEDKKYNTADLLFSYDFPTKMMINGKEQIIQSVVKSLLIDCKSGLTAPVVDYYFKEQKPTREMKPLGGLEYPTNAETVFPVDKNTTLYNSLCPRYI